MYDLITLSPTIYYRVKIILVFRCLNWHFLFSFFYESQYRQVVFQCLLIDKFVSSEACVAVFLDGSVDSSKLNSQKVAELKFVPLFIDFHNFL